MAGVEAGAESEVVSVPEGRAGAGAEAVAWPETEGQAGAEAETGAGVGEEVDPSSLLPL